MLRRLYRHAPVGVQIGGSARDYLPGFAWLVGALWSNARERLSVCLCIGTLGVNVRICRISRGMALGGPVS
jgi:hypothetical protein